MREKYRQQLREHLSTGARNAKELTRELNISQPTLSRLMNDMAKEIIPLGKGRATRYGIPLKIHGTESRFPVFRIDPRGDAHLFGHLTALQNQQYWWEDENKNGKLFNQLPWFLMDFRMSGYGARIFAYEQREKLGLPGKLADWNDHDMLLAASRHSDNRCGNLILGEQSLARYLDWARFPQSMIDLDKSSWAYSQLARQSLTGKFDTSQISGEQPKFTICTNDRGTPCQMLVKFSPAANSKEARRYADLLICEHLALEAIRMAGFSAARSRLVITENQVFLCLKRFDRRGSIGRLPLISLKSLHAKLNSPCDNWISAAKRLEEHELITPKDSEKLCWLALFSDLTAHHNQHFGNVSLIPHQKESFLLSPAYGIRPTLYEPIAGEIPVRLFIPPPVSKKVAELLPGALEAAILFWKSAAIDERISSGFRQICYENCERLKHQDLGPKLTPLHQEAVRIRPEAKI